MTLGSLGLPGGSDDKLLPTIQETEVQSLGWKDLLEKEMATHSSSLAQKISWTEEPGKLQSMGLQRVGHDSMHARAHTYTHIINGGMASLSYLIA